MQVNNTLADHGLAVGVVVARDLIVRPSSDELNRELDALIAQKKQQEFPAAIKDAVRNLLKGGGFKPSGRNKPASEYLAQAAREDRFPRINNLVDVNNLISLQTGLPISLLDFAAFGESLLLRHGRDGEKYVFNSTGQEIDLAGLICACNATTDQPLGNAIKDSMQGKIKPTTTSVIGIIYAPQDGPLYEAMRENVSHFAELLKREGSAISVDVVVA